jgi:hypothetical protein
MVDGAAELLHPPNPMLTINTAINLFIIPRCAPLGNVAGSLFYRGIRIYEYFSYFVPTGPTMIRRAFQAKGEH